MAAPANTLVPILSGLHWLDLEQLFELKITFQLKTPLGTYHKEYKLQFQDLVSAVAAITNIWAGVAPAMDDTTFAYRLGLLDKLDDLKAGLQAVPSERWALPTVAPGYSDLEGYTGPDVPYDPGSGDTAWGQTPPA
jgi:hypothetical protein